MEPLRQLVSNTCATTLLYKRLLWSPLGSANFFDLASLPRGINFQYTDDNVAVLAESNLESAYVHLNLNCNYSAPVNLNKDLDFLFKVFFKKKTSLDPIFLQQQDG